MIKNVVLIMIGGGLGSGCRYLFSSFAYRWFGNGFAWGTLGVNLIGCFLIGLVYALTERSLIPATLRHFLMIGFLGGFTTFSAFALESVNFISNGQVFNAVLNLTLNNLAGLILVACGIWLTRYFF